jgi:hypothetical protein
MSKLQSAHRSFARPSVNIWMQEIKKHHSHHWGEFIYQGDPFGLISLTEGREGDSLALSPDSTN